jgi:hypothetical protein
LHVLYQFCYNSKNVKNRSLKYVKTLHPNYLGNLFKERFLGLKGLLYKEDYMKKDICLTKSKLTSYAFFIVPSVYLLFILFVFIFLF